MYTKQRPFLLHALTSVHAGSGSEIGLVDLPVQREKHTGFPKVESSSLKGAIRHHVELSHQQEEQKIRTVFGSKPEASNSTDSMTAAAGFADAKILLFPIRSAANIFALITCPYAIRKLQHDLELAGAETEIRDVKPNTVAGSSILTGNQKNAVILEEYSFPVNLDENTKTLADTLQSLLAIGGFPHKLSEHLVVLEDNEFRDFVQLSTEVNARIAINQKTGTVDKKKGALWYEENVPAESVFYSTLYIGQSRTDKQEDQKSAEEIEEWLTGENGFFPKVFQLGGNYTIGRGMLRTYWVK